MISDYQFGPGWTILLIFDYQSDLVGPFGLFGGRDACFPLPRRLAVFLNVAKRTCFEKKSAPK